MRFLLYLFKKKKFGFLYMTPLNLNPASAPGKKIASTVLDKVPGTGTTIMTKVMGTSGETEDVGGKGPESDKGVSVKQYLVEKLRPGEEDKALSETISEALHKRKEEGTDHKEGKPMGEVKESEEVAKRLGTGDEPSGGERAVSGDVKVSSIESGGNTGVVDRVKGAVSSWLGKGTGEEGVSSGEVAHGH